MPPGVELALIDKLPGILPAIAGFSREFQRSSLVGFRLF